LNTQRLMTTIKEHLNNQTMNLKHIYENITHETRKAHDMIT